MKVFRFIRYIKMLQLVKVLVSTEVRKEMKKVASSIKTLIADIAKLATTVAITWAVK